MLKLADLLADGLLRGSLGILDSVFLHLGRDFHIGTASMALHHALFSTASALVHHATLAHHTTSHALAHHTTSHALAHHATSHAHSHHAVVHMGVTERRHMVNMSSSSSMASAGVATVTSTGAATVAAAVS